MYYKIKFNSIIHCLYILPFRFTIYTSDIIDMDPIDPGYGNNKYDDIF